MAASSLAPGVPGPNFFSPERRRAFPAPCLPQIFPAFLLLVLLLGSGVGSSALAAAESRITVDATVKPGQVNPLLFGQNLLFAGNGLWDPQRNDLDPEARSLLQALAPTIVRFPGGSTADLYLWEDGVGVRTSAPVPARATSIPLDGSPHWEMVTKGRFQDSQGDTSEDSFNFNRLEGNRIMGVIGLKAAHPAGATVRPGVRSGQPDWFSNLYGILEHMKLVRTLGAQSIITVNYGTGLDKLGRLSTSATVSQRARRAAALVAFVNGKPGDTRPLGADEEGNDWQTIGFWAEKRVRQGYPEPLGVRYWEVGNEVYDRHEKGFSTAQQYAQDLVTFARAMKAVDPAIKIGAVGNAFPRGRGDADVADEWNSTVIKQAGDSLDFLIIHPYYPGAGQGAVAYRSQAWFTAVMAGAQEALADLKEIRSIIAANAAPGKPIEIVVTEYGIWPSESKDARDYVNLGRALYDADLLMGLLKDGAGLGVTLATAWNLHGSNPTAAIRYDWSTGKRVLRPHYYAMELIKNHLEPQLVGVQVSSPTFAVEQVGNVKAHPALPALGALAAISRTGQRLTLLVLNRSLTGPITTTIRLAGFGPQAVAQVRILSGNSASSHNEDNPGAVAPVARRLDNAGPEFDFTFAAHSLTLLEFQAQP